MKTTLVLAGLLFAAFTVANAQDASKATAKLEPKSGSKVTGTITFTKSGDDVEVTGDVENLSPGKHGFHVHDKGDCSAPDAASAGSHFNPTHQHNGGPDTAEQHAGDLGNIETDR